MSRLHREAHQAERPASMTRAMKGKMGAGAKMPMMPAKMHKMMAEHQGAKARQGKR